MDQQSFKLSLAAAHHIQSFNYLIDGGLNKVLARFTPMELNQADILHENPNNRALKLPYHSIKITYSQLKLGQPYRFSDPTALTQEIYPQECRLGSKTYASNLMAEITRDIDGNVDTFTADLGTIPIMVRSKSCHLNGLGEQELIALNEDPNEFGGYFIVNGN
jgi:DNA-directed RNA polymerase I subunit RPA2